MEDSDRIGDVLKAVTPFYGFILGSHSFRFTTVLLRVCLNRLEDGVIVYCLFVCNVMF